MNNEEWDEFYLLAAKETDRKKMPERIVAARQAIGERWRRGLVGCPNHHAERQQVEDALRALATLELEARSWQPHSGQYRGLTQDPKH